MKNRLTLLLGLLTIATCGCSSQLTRDLELLSPIPLPEMRLPAMPAFSSGKADFRNESRVVNGVNVDEFTSAPLQRFKQVRLNAPPETVFDYVGNHEEMSDWLPMLHRVTVDHSNSQNGPQTCGVGSERLCELGPDHIRERIVVWEPDRMFAYRVLDGQKGLPIDGGFGLLTFEPAGSRSTMMTWRIYYSPKKWNPKAAVMPQMVNLQLNGGLKNLVKRFGGEIVAR